MRTTTLILTLSLAAAAFAALPSAEASRQACTFQTDGCAGWVCADVDGSGRYSDNECVSKSDLDIDQCQFQSDCCSTLTSFWCPEDG